MKVNCIDGSVKQVSIDEPLKNTKPLSYTINQIDIDRLGDKSPTELKSWISRLSRNLTKCIGD
jgi:hypothetical protein